MFSFFALAARETAAVTKRGNLVARPLGVGLEAGAKGGSLASARVKEASGQGAFPVVSGSSLVGLGLGSERIAVSEHLAVQRRDGAHDIGQLAVVKLNRIRRRSSDALDKLGSVDHDGDPVSAPVVDDLNRLGRSVGELDVNGRVVERRVSALGVAREEARVALVLVDAETSEIRSIVSGRSERF